MGGFAFAGFAPPSATAPLATDQEQVATPAPTATFEFFRPAPAWPHSSELVPHSAQDFGRAERTDPEPEHVEPAETPEAPAIPADGGRLSEAQVRSLAATAGWPVEWHDQLVNIAWCESRFDPAATNGPDIHGLMQVHTMWFDYAGVDLALWDDPLVNLEVALAVFNYDLEKGNAPWRQWECQPGTTPAPSGSAATEAESEPVTAIDNEQAAPTEAASGSSPVEPTVEPALTPAPAPTIEPVPPTATPASPGSAEPPPPEVEPTPAE